LQDLAINDHIEVKKIQKAEVDLPQQNVKSKVTKWGNMKFRTWIVQDLYGLYLKILNY
jgi:hypothetical protein